MIHNQPPAFAHVLNNVCVNNKKEIKFEKKLIKQKFYGEVKMELKKLRIMEILLFLACPPFFPCRNYDPLPQSGLGKFRLSSFLEINGKDWLCGCWRPHLHGLG